MPDFQAAKEKLEQAQQEYQAAIAGERKSLLEQRAEIDRKLAALDGVTAAPASTGKRRTGVKDSVLNLITRNGSMNKSQVLEGLGAKGDKSFEGSISNALASMKKAGTLTQDDEGNYKV